MGRKKEEVGTLIGVRIRKADLAILDDYVNAKGLSRQDVIRDLIRLLSVNARTDYDSVLERAEEAEAGCEAWMAQFEEIGDEVDRLKAKVERLKKVINNPEAMRRRIAQLAESDNTKVD